MTHLLQWVALAAEAARGAVAKLVDERTAAHLREVSDPRRRVQPRGQRLQRLAARLRLQPRVQGRLQLLRHGERARTDAPRQLRHLLLRDRRRRLVHHPPPRPLGVLDERGAVLPPLLERLRDGSSEASPRGLPPPRGLHGARRHRPTSLVPPVRVLGAQRLEPIELALERCEVLAPLEARLGVEERVERRRRRRIARPGQRLLVDRRVARRQRSLRERKHGERVKGRQTR